MIVFFNAGGKLEITQPIKDYKKDDLMYTFFIGEKRYEIPIASIKYIEDAKNE
jgi:hypothetical protein